MTTTDDLTTPLIYRAGRLTSTVASPDSCALCGVPEHEHAQHFYGRHLGDDVPKGYVAPDDATRLARMRARREEAA